MISPRTAFLNNSAPRSIQGAALTELALILPFLLTTIFGIIEIGHWLNSHFMASRIAFEAARYAVSLPELPETPVGSIGTRLSTTTQTCTDDVNYCAVLNRIRGLQNRYNNGHQGRIEKIDFIIERRKPLTESAENWVKIQITLPFTPIVGSWLPLREIKSSARAAYLYRGL